MKAGWQAFLCALQFLTLIPVRLAAPLDERTQARALLYYPMVGGLIGLCLLLLATVLQGVPTGLSAAVLLLVWAGLTGGLHLDGLADSADGWMGGLGSRERTLEIMKDPHLGASGALVLILVLLLKWSALSALLSVATLWPLLLAPVAGRGAALLLLVTTPYARPDGIARDMLPRLQRRHALWVCAAVILLLGLFGLWLSLSLLLAGAGLRWLMMRRLGGTTGDTAGASIELVETLLLVLAVIIQNDTGG
jgi:adenosylcobinamide-GDP ribazoletransferase